MKITILINPKSEASTHRECWGKCLIPKTPPRRSCLQSLKLGVDFRSQVWNRRKGFSGLRKPEEPEQSMCRQGTASVTSAEMDFWRPGRKGRPGQALRCSDWQLRQFVLILEMGMTRPFGFGMMALFHKHTEEAIGHRQWVRRVINARTKWEMVS